MSEPRRVIVMGGGLAGIAASVRLAQSGAAVTLLETSRRLGGRATSHVDPVTGERVDNCQHVLLGCCTNLLDLYRRLGVSECVSWHRDLHFFDKFGHHDVMIADDLPAPLHLSQSLLRFGTLTLGEKIAIARAMIAMMRMGPAGRALLGDVTFEHWLREHGQPDKAIHKFWAVIIVSALNQWPAKATASHAIQVFQEGFLAHRDAYMMGVAAVPLGQLYDSAGSVIEAAGGRVRYGAAVARIHGDARSVTGVELADGERLTADAYISALPFDRLDKAISDDLRRTDRRLGSLDRFTYSPILGIHLHFAEPVTQHPHLIFVDSPLQWVFNKDFGLRNSDCGLKGGEAATPAPATMTDGLAANPQSPIRNPQSQYLHGVISAADEWVDKPAERIIDMAVAELGAYAPRARRVPLAHARVIKEKRATFASVPGIDAFRPAAVGPTANLLLAGDWTDTGWPATMEGAVRSGYRAAAAALGADEPPLVADLPTAPLVQMAARFG